MSNYRFAALPSNSAVAAAVTLIVSGWLLAAGATIIADPVAEAPQAAPARAAAPTPTVAVAPGARFVINVEARRG